MTSKRNPKLYTPSIQQKFHFKDLLVPRGDVGEARRVQRQQSGLIGDLGLPLFRPCFLLRTRQAHRSLTLTGIEAQLFANPRNLTKPRQRQLPPDLSAFLSRPSDWTHAVMFNL